MTGATKRSILFGLVVAALVAAPAMAGVLGQVALNEVKVDGTVVPTGTTVMSPSLLETGSYPSTVHLATGQVLSLGPDSSAYLRHGSEGGIELTARSGEVRVGEPGGDTFQIASNTMAMLDEHEPGGGAPAQKLKMCEPCASGEDCKYKATWVPMTEADIQAKIDAGWGVANVDPFDDNCNKTGAGAFVWTSGKIAALVGGAVVLGVIAGQEDDKIVEIECQSPNASPIVPGVPICST